MTYPEALPYDEGFLKVSDIHNIYYMQCGKPDGKPVIFLHGGPGGSISPSDTVFFNPNVYRVVLISQRGAGKSEPTADLRENTTWDLVEDIEKIRKHLSIEKWMVFGGSWGSTLSLAYAETHPDRCTALVLRGIFLVRKIETDTLYQQGASWVFPEEFEAFESLVPKEERHDMVKAYYKLLTHEDDNISLEAAKAWSRWESQVSRLKVDEAAVARSDNDLRWARAFARIECHYFINNAFMEDGFLIKEEQISKIRHIPCIAVQGRYDIVCFPFSAFDLKKAWGKGLDLRIADDAGHSAKEPTTARMLTEACDEFAKL